MFPEALLLHYMDDLDSKMEAMRAHFEREADMESPWSSYNASLGRPLLNSAKFLAPKAAAAPDNSSSAVENDVSQLGSGSESRETTPTLPGFKA
jgi:3'-5' exoribonuclease